MEACLRRPEPTRRVSEDALCRGDERRLTSLAAVTIGLLLEGMTIGAAFSAIILLGLLACAPVGNDCESPHEGSEDFSASAAPNV